jgi:hypothetical protein
MSAFRIDAPCGLIDIDIVLEELTASIVRTVMQ